MSRPTPTSSNSQTRSIPRLAVAAVALVVALALLAAMFWKAEFLVRVGLVGHVWYVILIVLGLAAAVCLFALFRSYASYTGKVLSGTIELGGPAVLMLVILLLGFKLVPEPATKFDLTVFVHGENGQQSVLLSNRGRLMLDLSADRRAEAIGPKGEVRFVGIPADQRGQSVPVSLDADGYELVLKEPSVRLDSGAAYLAVRPKLLRLTGEVLGAQDRPVVGARIHVGARDAVTDADGRFELALPFDLPDQERGMTIAAAGYATWRGTAVPGSGALIVRLDKTP